MVREVISHKPIEAKDYENLLESIDGKLVLLLRNGPKGGLSTAASYNSMSITRRAADPFTLFAVLGWGITRSLGRVPTLVQIPGPYRISQGALGEVILN